MVLAGWSNCWFVIIACLCGCEKPSKIQFAFRSIIDITHANIFFLFFSLSLPPVYFISVSGVLLKETIIEYMCVYIQERIGKNISLKLEPTQSSCSSMCVCVFLFHFSHSYISGLLGFVSGKGEDGKFGMKISLHMLGHA